MSLTDERYLADGLRRMGFEPQIGNFSITQYGTTEKAEVLLDDAVGFSQQEDGTFAMVGDFYHSDIPGLRKYYGHNADFAREVTNAYTLEKSIDELAQQEFNCVENLEGTVGQDGMITLIFEQ